MNIRHLAATALITAGTAIAALSATSASATALQPGSYMIANTTRICIQANGNWYDQDYVAGGHWLVGASGQTVIFGYDSNVSESMIVTHMAVQWTEWAPGYSYQNFTAGPVTKLAKLCNTTTIHARPARPHLMD